MPQSPRRAPLDVALAASRSPVPGQRDAEGIVKWMKRKAGPGAILLEDEAGAAAFLDSHSVAVVGFFHVSLLIMAPASAAKLTAALGRPSPRLPVAPEHRPGTVASRALVNCLVLHAFLGAFPAGPAR